MLNYPYYKWYPPLREKFSLNFSRYTTWTKIIIGTSNNWHLKVHIRQQLRVLFFSIFFYQLWYQQQPLPQHPDYNKLMN